MYHNIVSLKQTSDACPSQWEGVTDEGKTVYIRYRFGGLTVQVGLDLGLAVVSEPIFSIGIGHSMEGIMSKEDMLKLTKSVIRLTEEL